MKSFKEYLNEAKKKVEYTEKKKWEEAAKSIDSKVKFTKEGHGGSQAIIASVPGSSQMIGKWFGDDEKGKGTIYK